MPSKELPRFVLDLISSAPQHGEGVHKWMFKLSRCLHAFRTHDEIEEILKVSLHGCGRNVPIREIHAAIADSKKCAWVPGTKQEIIYRSAWPAFNQKEYNLITHDGLGAYDLWEKSPVRFVDDRAYTEDIIDVIFPGNPLLCCGLSNSVFETKSRQAWRDTLEQQQFIQPSPCIAEKGLTKDGKESAHCLSNVGPRRFLVVEQDKGNQDQQCAVIVHLSKWHKLTLVLSSGGKSLHAWFFVEGQDESHLKKFMKTAVSLGADDATWAPVQFVRMPDGIRDNGRRQSVFYFDNELI